MSTVWMGRTLNLIAAGMMTATQLEAELVANPHHKGDIIGLFHTQALKNRVLDSEAVTDVFIGSGTAISAIAESETALELFLSAPNVISKTAASEDAITAIAASNYGLQNLTHNTTLLRALLDESAAVTAFLDSQSALEILLSSPVSTSLLLSLDSYATIWANANFQAAFLNSFVNVSNDVFIPIDTTIINQAIAHARAATSSSSYNEMRLQNSTDGTSIDTFESMINTAWQTLTLNLDSSHSHIVLSAEGDSGQGNLSFSSGALNVGTYGLFQNLGFTRV